MSSIAELFLNVDTTAICDADKTTRVLDSGIRPRSANPRIAGPAFTVRCRDDFLPVLRAIEAAAEGDVIVVDGGGHEIALAGELFARGALARRLGGIIVDGGYRDMAYVSTCPLPVYSRFVTPLAGTTVKLGELNVPVTYGGFTRAPFGRAHHCCAPVPLQSHRWILVPFVRPLWSTSMHLPAARMLPS